MQPQTAPQAAPQAAPGQQAPAGTPPMAPEQEKAMQLVVKQAMSVILQDNTARTIVQKASQGDPKQAVASVVGPILKRIYESAQAAGANVGMVALLGAGIQIIGVLAKMLEAAGVLQEQEIPQFCAQVAKMAVDEHNAGIQAGGGQPAPAAPAGAPAGGMIQPQGAPA